MEVGKSFGSDLGFLHKNMGSSLPEAVVFETILASQRSLACLLSMAGFLLKDTDTLGNSERFPFAELHRMEKTEPEAKDGSDTEDDDEDEDAEEADDDAADEDFSGDDGGDDDDDDDDDEEGDPDEDPAANGNQGSDDDDDDDDDEQDNDDDDEDDEEEEEDEDEEEQPPEEWSKADLAPSQLPYIASLLHPLLIPVTRIDFMTANCIF